MFPGDGTDSPSPIYLGYADILVLGSILPGTFVSKADVARWPGIGFLASIAGTVYVDREDRAAAGAFAAELKARIVAGDTLLLFPRRPPSSGRSPIGFMTTSRSPAGVPFP